MRKTLIIDGQKVELKSTGAIAKRYKFIFGKDYFAEVMRLAPLTKMDLENLDSMNYSLLDMEVFYNFIYILALTADPALPNQMDWLDSFDEFPIMELIPEIQDILLHSMQSNRKKM